MVVPAAFNARSFLFLFFVDFCSNGTFRLISFHSEQGLARGLPSRLNRRFAEQLRDSTFYVP